MVCGKPARDCVEALVDSNEALIDGIEPDPVGVQADDGSATFELEAEGLLAVAIQHEYDHLQGTLMIDHMGPLKKRLTHRKMVKRAEEQATP